MRRVPHPCSDHRRTFRCSRDHGPHHNGLPNSSTGGFRVIPGGTAMVLCHYSTKGEEKNPNQHYDCVDGRDDLRQLPVELLAANDCALFIWCTWPLQTGIWQSVIEAWGFTYAGLAWEWRKYNPDTGKWLPLAPDMAPGKIWNPACWPAGKPTPEI